MRAAFIEDRSIDPAILVTSTATPDGASDQLSSMGDLIGVGGAVIDTF